MVMVMRIAVRMTMRMPTHGVGARLGIKRRLVVLEPRTKPLGQLFQHMVRRKAHVAAGVTLVLALADTEGHVAVAQVVAQPSQRKAGVRPRRYPGGHHRFRRSDDPDAAAVLGLKTVAVAQHRTAFEKQTRRTPAVQGHPQAPLDAIVVAQGQGVLDSVLPIADGQRPEPAGQRQ